MKKLKIISMVITLGLFATGLSLFGVFGPAATIAVKWGLASLVVLYGIAFVYKVTYKLLQKLSASPRRQETEKVGFEIENMLKELKKEEIKIKTVEPVTLNQLQNKFKK